MPRGGHDFSVTQVKSLDFASLEAYVGEHRYAISREMLDDEGWSLAEGPTQALLAKLRGAGVPLGEYVEGRIYYGIKTGLNEAFVIDAATRDRLIREDPRSAELIKPFLLGREVKRYAPLISARYLIFTRHGVKIRAYPAILRYLSQFKDRLMPKPKDWRGEDWPGRKPGAYEWYEIQDTVDYFAEFEKPKIIVPAIVQNGSYAFDTDGLYSNDKTSIVVTDDLYILGLLNSKVCDFVLHSLASTKQGGYYEYKPMYISQLPIRPINPADVARHDRMVALVQQMLDLKQQQAAAEAAFDDSRHDLAQKIERLDAEIDALVYDLYGLTDEEIALIEGRSA